MVSVVLAALLAAGQAVPGGETVITNAANGGLRDWQPVKGSPGELYVRDRTERWYRVKLTGPCERYRPYSAMSYTTNGDIFDRFSTVRFLGAGPMTCGVVSIVRSATPPAYDSKAAR